MDIYELDKLRILGPIALATSVQERVRVDAELRATVQIAQEQVAAAQAREQALREEAATIAQAETIAVERLEKIRPLYLARDDADRRVREVVAELWLVEKQIRAELREVDRTLEGIMPFVEPTTRAGWRESLRTRAGLPPHVSAREVTQANSEGAAVGVTVCRGIAAGVIQPGAIAAGRDVVNL